MVGDSLTKPQKKRNDFHELLSINASNTWRHQNAEETQNSVENKKKKSVVEFEPTPGAQ